MSTLAKQRGVLLSKMLMLATEGHNGQFDKGGRPYILHPLAVMHKLRTDDEELQCIALGHDIVEDGNVLNHKTGLMEKVTFGMLRTLGFTERIIEGIRCLTRMPGQSEDEYRDGVLGNVDAMRVKRRDLEHNSDLRRLKGLSDKDMARMRKYAEFHFLICARLAQVERAPAGLVMDAAES